MILPGSNLKKHEPTNPPPNKEKKKLQLLGKKGLKVSIGRVFLRRAIGPDKANI